MAGIAIMETIRPFAPLFKLFGLLPFAPQEASAQCPADSVDFTFVTPEWKVVEKCLTDPILGKIPETETEVMPAFVNVLHPSYSTG